HSSSRKIRKRGSAFKPSLTCTPFTLVTTTSIGPPANKSPTGVLGSRSSIGSILTAWPGLRVRISITPPFAVNPQYEHGSEVTIGNLDIHRLQPIVSNTIVFI